MDFQQGLITTIHEYGVTKNLLKELNKSLKKRSTSILIPCLYEEFERPALKGIREVLKDLTGLNELVIALSAKTVDQVKAAKSFFHSMPFPVHVQWTNSPCNRTIKKPRKKWVRTFRNSWERMGCLARHRSCDEEIRSCCSF